MEENKEKPKIKEKQKTASLELKGKVSSKEETSEKSKIMAIIRISGMVKVRKDVKDTLYRLRLRRKYSCVLINLNKNLSGMLEKVKHYVAYGEINKETLNKLIKTRAQLIDKNKKIDSEKACLDILSGKSLKKLGLKPFFRLHPPRKGIKSKRQYPIGVIGNNKKDINKLIERML